MKGEIRFDQRSEHEETVYQNGTEKSQWQAKMRKEISVQTFQQNCWKR
jgi:hypothetical protein